MCSRAMILITGMLWPWRNSCTADNCPRASFLPIQPDNDPRQGCARALYHGEHLANSRAGGYYIVNHQCTPHQGCTYQTTALPMGFHFLAIVSKRHIDTVLISERDRGGCPQRNTFIGRPQQQIKLHA